MARISSGTLRALPVDVLAKSPITRASLTAAGLLLYVGCGVERTHGSDPATGERNDGGAAGASTDAAGGAVAEDAGADAGPSGAAGAPADCVDASCVVARAAEQALTEGDVVTEVDVLAGKSFTLDPTLCPELDVFPGYENLWSCGETGALLDPCPRVPLLTLHIRRSSSGDLEAVALTRSSGFPLVQILPMRRAGLGWDLSDVMTCAELRLGAEVEYITQRYTAEAVHIVFERDLAAGDAGGIVVAASTDREPKVVRGRPDTTPPSYAVLDRRGNSVDSIENWGNFDAAFFFSEPVAADVHVFVKDPLGHRAELGYTSSEGYTLGFDVPLLTDVSLEIHAKDLAGNDLIATQPHPGISIAPVTGDFEGDVEYLDSDVWRFDAPSSCNHVGAGTSYTLSNGGLAVPALTGSRSFLLGDAEYDGYCVVYLRMKRAAGATRLRFDARRIGEWADGASLSTYLAIRSLQIGGESASVRDERVWTIDPVYTAGSLHASTIATLSFDLPVSGDDFLIEFSADDVLWIDSLRTE